MAILDFIINKIGKAASRVVDDILIFQEREKVIEVLLSMSGVIVPDSEKETLEDLSKDFLLLIKEIEDFIDGNELEGPQALELLSKIKRIITLIKGLDNLNINSPDGSLLSSLLLDYLKIRVLEIEFAEYFHFLRSFGIISSPGLGIGNIIKFEKERFSSFFISPSKLLENTFRIEGKLYAYKLLSTLEDLFRELGISAYWADPSEKVREYLKIQIDDESQDRSLWLTIFDVADGNASGTVELELFPVKDPSTKLYHSFILNPFLAVQLGSSFDLENNWSVWLNSTSGAFSSELISLSFDDIKLVNTGQGDLSVNSEFRIELKRKIKVSPNLKNGGFDITYNGISFGLLTRGLSKPNLFFETGLGIGLGIKPNEDGDSFINYIIPRDGIMSNIELTLGWLSDEGLYFNAEGGLETTIPIHRTIGPVALKNIYFYLGIQDTALIARVSNSFFVKLGVVNIQVDKIGLESILHLNREGNLGQFDLEGPGFLSPSGLGVDLDAGIISGSGFLEIDKPNHRYAGILALDMKAIELTGVGLIATRLPNGQPGFSMLVTINVVLFPPIQLSFGFTLAGVGGLIGIDRTMKVDPLRERIASGAVNSIMFPEDPIQNADRVISDLRAIFPPESSHFIVGPFLKIGFGTPSIIEFDLGVLLEFPFKGRIILLGSLGIYLPTKKTVLVEIHVDIVGDFNFAEQYIRVEGRLRQSEILDIALKGGFAFMLDWGPRPGFLFSIGGYHPRYKKPARFPEIPRLSALVELGDIVKLSCSYYQAISSNSFQIGFSADLVVGTDGVRLIGHWSFNALLQFNPFFFSVDQSMSVKLQVKGQTFMGIGFFFRLEGPKPWRVVGRAEISVLFITITVEFDKKFGEEQNNPPVEIEAKTLLDDIVESLDAKTNWSAKLPTGFNPGEMLQPLEDLEEEGLVLHPSGFLEVRQTAAPLERTIEKLGNAYVKNKPQFRIGEVKIGGTAPRTEYRKDLNEFFARGQYEDLSEIEKLYSPDFEEMKAGLSFGESSSDIDLGMDGPEIVSHDSNALELVIVRGDRTTETIKLFFEHGPWVRRIKSIGSSRNRHIRESLEERFRILEDLRYLDVAEQFHLVDVSDLSVIDGLGSGGNIFESYGEVRLFQKNVFEATGREVQIINRSIFDNPINDGRI